MFIALRFAARMTFAHKSASKLRNQHAQLLPWHMFNVLPANPTACVVVPDLWCSLVKIPDPKLLVNAFNCFMTQMRQRISTETLWFAFSTKDSRVCHATSALIKWSSWQSSALRFGYVFCFDFISSPRLLCPTWALVLPSWLIVCKTCPSICTSAAAQLLSLRGLRRLCAWV